MANLEAADEAARLAAIEWLKGLRCGETWRFRFSEPNPPTLIATSVAAMLGKFLGWVDALSDAERAAWAEEIMACQLAESGWFDDADIADGNRTTTLGKGGLQVEVTRIRALLHRTRHAICALDALGHEPRHPLSVVATEYQGAEKMRAWLSTLDLGDYWYTSNMMMDAYLMVDFQRRRTLARERFGIVRAASTQSARARARRA